MGDRIIRVYKNNGDKTLDVPGAGEIPPGGQASVITEHHETVILENYPGLVDVIAEEEAAANAAQTKEPTDE